MLHKEKIRYNIKDLGVIMNPAAGAGKAVIQKIAARAIEKFNDCNVIYPDPGEGRESTMHNAIEIAPIVDAILVVGGDGTMSDVAYSLYESGISTPIIGIWAGSTNAR